MKEIWKSIVGTRGGKPHATVLPVEGKSPSRVAVQMVDLQAGEAEAQGIPVYPPLDPGIRVANPDELLITQASEIERLRRNVSIDEAEFQRNYIVPLKAVANAINLLPADREHHHTGAGGLFRLCLDMGIAAQQAAEGRMFSGDESIETRRRIEVAWRHAAYLTGLCCELYRPITQMMVVTATGEVWSPFLGPLVPWARERGVGRIYVRWYDRTDVRSASNTLGIWFLGSVINPALMAQLHTASPKIVETMFGVVGGILTSDQATLANVILQTRRRVISADQQLAPETYGKLTAGGHLEPHLLDAMRSLIQTGTWRINERGSRCHYGTDGLFVAWKMGAAEISAHLSQRNISGIPESSATLAEILGAAGIITASSDGGWIHLARPVGRPDATPMPTIHLASPQAILGQKQVMPAPEMLRMTRRTPQNNPTVAPAVTVVPAVVVTEPIDVAPAVEATISKSPEATPMPPGEPSQIATAQAPKAPTTIAVTAQANQSQSTAPRPIRPKAEGKAPAKQVPTKAPPAVEDRVADEFSAEMLLELGLPVCRELAVIRKLWHDHNDKAGFLMHPQGLAVSWKVLSSGAMPVPMFMGALQAKNYCVTFKTAGGIPRPLEKHQFADGEQLGAVFTNKFLQVAGFRMG